MDDQRAQIVQQAVSCLDAAVRSQSWTLDALNCSSCRMPNVWNGMATAAQYLDTPSTDHTANGSANALLSVGASAPPSLPRLPTTIPLRICLSWKLRDLAVHDCRACAVDGSTDRFRDELDSAFGGCTTFNSRPQLVLEAYACIQKTAMMLLLVRGQCSYVWLSGPLAAAIVCLSVVCRLRVTCTGCCPFRTSL